MNKGKHQGQCYRWKQINTDRIREKEKENISNFTKDLRRMKEKNKDDMKKKQKNVQENWTFNLPFLFFHLNSSFTAEESFYQTSPING